MLYYLLDPLHTEVSLLNVTQYITFRTAAASITAFLFSLMLGPWVIRSLQRLQVGQVIRHDGPESHGPKAGTPTMGGLLILGAAITPTLLWVDLANAYVWVAVLSTMGFAAIGFADDYLKVVHRSHHGLRPRFKLAAQCVVGVLVGMALLRLSDQGLYNTQLIFPFFKGLMPDLGWLYVPFAVLVLVGSSNAVNLTDGLDGLAISVFTVSAAAFTALAYISGHAVFAAYLLIVRFSPAAELTVFCGSLVGAGLGFLWYNSYPADVFMGGCWLSRAWWSAGNGRASHQTRTATANHRRGVRHRGTVRDRAGGLLQVDRSARVQDGAAAPSLRTDWLE